MTGWLRQIIEDAREGLSHDAPRDYLTSRGFTATQAYQAGAGYLPGSYYCTGTADFLKWAGSGPRDHLRGRLVFPYTTADGKVIGLQTRSLHPTSRDDRYQTYVLPQWKGVEPAIFNAMHAARRLYDTGCRQVVVVEGPMDVLAVRAAGETAVIATHTAMVPNTVVEWLRRWSSGIVLALLDMDEQGRDGVEKLLDAGLTVAAPLYATHDPAELWTTQPDALRALVNPAQDDLALMIRGLL